MKKGNILLTISFIFCICCIAVCAIVTNNAVHTDAIFVQPEFETSAQQGIPEVPSELGWSELYQDGMPFSARICGAVHVENGAAKLYFTNTTPSDVWIMLKIFDEDGNILGQTGLIRPDEYIENVGLIKTPEEGTSIDMKIMAYEPDTYYSLGAVNLSTYIASVN